MSHFECPHCGYITREVTFTSCPGCGCEARGAYVQLPEGASAGTTGSAPRGKDRRLFLHAPEDPVLVPATGSPTLAAAGAFDHPVRPLIQLWYAALPARKRRLLDRSMRRLMDSPEDTRFSLLIPRERDILIRKLLEIVALHEGLMGKRRVCGSCTYHMGGGVCEIEDIVAGRGGSAAGGTCGPTGACRFHTARVDLDHLTRRLRFRFTPDR